MSNSGGAQQSHFPSQHASSSTIPCDGSGGGGGGKSSALFDSPRLLHSSSLPSGNCTAKNPMSDSETPYSMSPTSVLDAAAAAAAFASSPDAGNKRRPWCVGCAGPHGLADALDCTDDHQKRSVLAAASRAVKAQAPLIRSCSIDRRVEFGVKNKSSWLPLRGGREAAAAAPGEMETSSEDYTCVISCGPNPRTVHIFGDRVVEGGCGGERPGELAAADKFAGAWS